MAKIINIEWMQPTRVFQCPSCTANALKADGKVVEDPCSHFLFSWDGQLEDFVESSNEVETILDDENLDIESPVSDSLIGSLSESAVVYQITTRDEALGPIVRIDAAAFDPLAT